MKVFLVFFFNTKMYSLFYQKVADALMAATHIDDQCGPFVIVVKNNKIIPVNALTKLVRPVGRDS
ncbi:MAG TPA: hypothetical protein VMW01_17690 [Williamwhitmania sp.]|nr:hypothetical protein [Williamwhitmania sp.]